jgi:hypothetical protein
VTSRLTQERITGVPEMNWTAEQILKLAPDAASAKAAQGLLAPKKWTSLGVNETAVWALAKAVAQIPIRLKSILPSQLSSAVAQAVSSPANMDSLSSCSSRSNRRFLLRLLRRTPSVIPEVRLGYTRRRNALRDVILCVDQSGSLAASVVYSGVFGTVLASIPSVRTKMVVFDTAVVDLTEELTDPVDLMAAAIERRDLATFRRKIGLKNSRLARILI